MPTLLAESPDSKFETAGPLGALGSLAVQLGGRGAAPRALVTTLRPGPADTLLAPGTPWQGFATATREIFSPEQPLLAALLLKTSLNFISNLLPVYSSLNDY